MTRKHFQLAAETLQCIPCAQVRAILANKWAKMFREANPHFDDKIFRRAVDKQYPAPTIKDTLGALTELQAELSREYIAAIQALVDKHQVYLATGHLSDAWQVRLPRSRVWHVEHEREHWDHPIFAELEALDASVQEWGIGPTNMEMYKPTKAQK